MIGNGVKLIEDNQSAFSFYREDFIESFRVINFIEIAFN